MDKLREAGHEIWRPAVLFLVSILLSSEALAVQREEGIVKIPSRHSVDETVDRLKSCNRRE
jgi:hypothetical protein